jgi:hypothetical protein
MIAVLFILLHCVNDPPSKLHPTLNLKMERLNDTSRVIISTSVAQNYSLYRIVDDTCMLKITHHELINGSDSLVVDNVAIENDSAAIRLGRFYGTHIVPDSLIQDSISIIKPYTTISTCVTDETKHEACALLKLYTSTPLVK